MGTNRAGVAAWVIGVCAALAIEVLLASNRFLAISFVPASLVGFVVSAFVYWVAVRWGWEGDLIDVSDLDPLLSTQTTAEPQVPSRSET